MSRSRIPEGKPWERVNMDGTPNRGSYAFGAAAGCVDFAIALLGSTDDMARVERLARMLVAMTDEIQAAVRPDGRPSRMDASHARARGVLRSVADTVPFPAEPTVGDVMQWRSVVLERAVKAIRIAAAVEDDDLEVRAVAS